MQSTSKAGLYKSWRKQRRNIPALSISTSTGFATAVKLLPPSSPSLAAPLPMRMVPLRAISVTGSALFTDATTLAWSVSRPVASRRQALLQLQRPINRCYATATRPESLLCGFYCFRCRRSRATAFSAATVAATAAVGFTLGTLTCRATTATRCITACIAATPTAACFIAAFKASPRCECFHLHCGFFRKHCRCRCCLCGRILRPPQLLVHEKNATYMVLLSRPPSLFDTRLHFCKLSAILLLHASTFGTLPPLFP